MTTVLAIDQGTSGTKALVVDSAGNIRGIAERAVQPEHSSGGTVEQDPRSLLDSVLDAGAEALAKAGLEVDVVTLANQGETVLAWDETTGVALSPMLVWQDRRADSVCRDMEEHRATVAQRTGLVLDPYFSAPKQAWIRRNLTGQGVVTTSDTWLLYQLTGEFVTDAATASRSLVTNLDTASWDPELLDLFGLEGERLPRIAASDEIIGSTKAFGPTIAVGGLALDQQAALFAQGCFSPGEAKCTFGTGAFFLANTGTRPFRSSAGLSSSVAWNVRGRTDYCIDGQVYTAASAVQWMQRMGLVSSAAQMDEVALDASESLLCVPAFAGLAGPWWAPEATATLEGITLATTPGHVVMAVLQGIAAQVTVLKERIQQDTGVALARLKVDGGLTRSRVLMQAVADIMQVEIDVYPSQHATALGAAALARMAVDPLLSASDAIISWQPSSTYLPQWSPQRAQDFLGRWKHAASITAGSR